MGRHGCKVPGCDNVREKCPTLSFFMFPVQPERKRAWCQALDLNVDIIGTNSLICSDHFDDDDVKQFGNSFKRQRLKSTAVPRPLHGPQHYNVPHRGFSETPCERDISMRVQCEQPMNTETELSVLRGKVTRMEQMVQKMSDKIGTILDNFRKHRENLLRVEQNLCSTLITQLGELKSSMVDVSKAKPNKKKKLRRSYDSNVNKNMASVVVDDRTSGAGAPDILAPIIPVSLPEVGPGAFGSNANTFNVASLANMAPLAPICPSQNQNIRLRVPVQTKSTNSCGGEEIVVDADELDDIKLECMDEEFLPESGNVDKDVEVIETGPSTCTGLHFETIDLVDSEDDEFESSESSDSEPEPQPSMTSSKPNQNAKTPTVPAIQITKITPILLTRKFASLAEARHRVKVEGKWSTKSTKRNSEGHLKTMYYACRADSNCPIEIVHQVDEETGAVTEYVGGGSIDHTHQHQPTTTRQKPALTLHHRPESPE